MIITNYLKDNEKMNSSSSIPPTRPKAKHLTNAEHIQIQILRNMNLTYQQIADKLKVSKSQVQYSLNKRKSSPGGSRGRRNFLSSEQVDQIEAFVCSSRETRQMTYLELAMGEFSEWAVTENQIGNALRRRGYTCRIALRKPPLTARHKIIRKQWAKDHLTWSIDEWSRVLWTDETYVSSSEHTRRHITRKVSNLLIFYVIHINHES